MNRVRFKTNKFTKPKTSTMISLVFLLICFFSYFFLHSFNQSVTPKLLEIASKNIDKFTYNLLNDYHFLAGISDTSFKNLINISKNKEEEIISVGYNMKEAYQIADEIIDRLQNDYTDLEYGKLNMPYFDENLSSGCNGFVLSMPMGVTSNQIFLTNLGPKIPVKIKFVGTILTNLKTRVSDYGINNAMVELYIEVTMTHEIITPVTFQNKTFTYEILLDARIINGSVPSYYGGLLETKSNILNIPNS